MNQDQFEAFAAWGEAVYANFPEAEVSTSFSLPEDAHTKPDISYTAYDGEVLEGTFVLKADGSIRAELQDEEMLVTPDGVTTFND